MVEYVLLTTYTGIELIILSAKILGIVFVLSLIKMFLDMHSIKQENT